VYLDDWEEPVQSHVVVRSCEHRHATKQCTVLGDGVNGRDTHLVVHTAVGRAGWVIGGRFDVRESASARAPAIAFVAQKEYFHHAQRTLPIVQDVQL